MAIIRHRQEVKYLRRTPLSVQYFETKSKYLAWICIALMDLYKGFAGDGS